MTVILLIQLTDTEAARLRQTAARNPAQRGGFQAHAHQLLKHLDGTIITLTDPVLIERTIRYRSRYGAGGFQNLFRAGKAEERVAS